MRKYELLRTGVSLVVSVGVGAIIDNVVKQTTPGNVKRFTKICITIGGFVLTSIAGDMAAKYTEGRIDDALNAVSNMMGGKKPGEEVSEEEA